ncbi:MAG: permease [Deferribacteres bacterium]|nr:permease [candidate division KSB1 bacterium]MCB9501080.1 permease [Deferribacteres bacterium]
MIERFKQRSTEVKIGISLIVVSILLSLIGKKNLWEIIQSNSQVILKILFLSMIAVGISTIVHFIVPEDFFKKYLRQNKLIYLFTATLLGILTPGPVYAIYPIVVLLKKEGINNAILVSYITGQTIVGPARIPFEVGLFGLNFFIYRVILSLAMGVAAGFLYSAISKVFPDEK